MNKRRVAVRSSARLATGLLVLLCGAAGADPFGAMPGLWKNTYQVEGAGEQPPRWHCVVEDANPWEAYAQIRQPKGYACKRTAFERTLTALSWRWECSGPEPFVSEGSLVFDSPKHYSGTVTLSGSLLDYPLHSRMKVEGTRLAACTSPSD